MTNDQFCCKIERVAEKYSLNEVDSFLKREHEDRTSIREMTDTLNRSIVRSAIEDINQESDSYFSVDRVYDLITNDGQPDYSDELRNKLKAADVSIRRLEIDTVSTETVRRHIRNCLDIESSRVTTLESGQQTINWSLSHHRSITEKTFNNLQKAGRIEIGDYEMKFTEPKVRCNDCANTYTMKEILNEQGCECSKARPFADNASQ